MSSQSVVSRGRGASPRRSLKTTAALFGVVLFTTTCGGGSGGSSTGSQTGGTRGSGGSGGASASGGSSGSGTGGSGSGGSTGGSGAGGSGTSLGTGGSGGTGSTGTGPAVMKFCNPLSLATGEPVTLTLQVGPSVKLSAASGTCTPMTKAACTMIPVGDMVPVTVTEGTNTVFDGMTTIGAGDNILVIADIDQMTGDFVLDGGRLDTTKIKCEDFDFSDLIPPDGGAGDDAGTTGTGGAGGTGGGRLPPGSKI